MSAPFALLERRFEKDLEKRFFVHSSKHFLDSSMNAPLQYFSIRTKNAQILETSSAVFL